MRLSSALRPLLATLPALAMLAGCTATDERSAEAKASAEADTAGGRAAAVLDSAIQRDFFRRDELRALADSLMAEGGRPRLLTPPGSEITAVAVGGRRMVFGPGGFLAMDSLPAEAGTPRAAAIPDLGYHEGDDFVPAEEARWRAVVDLSGSGDGGETGPFRVRSREWRIVYGGRPSWPIEEQRLRVFDERDRWALQAHREGEGVDTTYAHSGPGVFRAELSGSTGRWTLRVEEKLLPPERAAADTVATPEEDAS